MKYLLTLLLLISFESLSCENKLISTFDSPQSLRYRIDSIMHYADTDGAICIKRMPPGNFVEILLIHPKKVFLLGIISKSVNSLNNKNFTIGPSDVAKYLLCDKHCPRELLSVIDNHPDFILLSNDIRNIIETLQPPFHLVTDDFKRNSKDFIQYLLKNKHHE